MWISWLCTWHIQGFDNLDITAVDTDMPGCQLALAPHINLASSPRVGRMQDPCKPRAHSGFQ